MRVGFFCAFFWSFVLKEAEGELCVYTNKIILDNSVGVGNCPMFFPLDVLRLEKLYLYIQLCLSTGSK